jgi:hypothetical protein
LSSVIPNSKSSHRKLVFTEDMSPVGTVFD